MPAIGLCLYGDAQALKIIHVLYLLAKAIPSVFLCVAALKDCLALRQARLSGYFSDWTNGASCDINDQLCGTFNGPFLQRSINTAFKTM